MRSLSEQDTQVGADADQSAVVAIPPGEMPPSEQLSMGTQLAFSAQGIFGAAMALLVTVYMGKFYLDVVLLPAGLYAVAIAVGRALDAISDPMMGFISDHTQSRWGRRKPWILLGVVGYALLFYLMLTPDPGMQTGEVMTYFMACYVASFCFATAAMVPRTALAAELTLDAQERTRLYGFITFFVGIGTLLGASGPSIWAKALPDPYAQMQGQAMFYTLGYVLLNGWFLLKVRERPEFMGRGAVPFVPGVRRALRNKPFRIMFVSHVLTAIPSAIPATLMPFFVQYVVKASAEWTGLLVVTYLASGVLSLPLWIRLARRIGKLRVWWIAAGIGITGGLAMGTVGEGDEKFMLLLEAYVGLQSMVFYAIGGAMHADVIDYDELHNGKRREAQFGALWSIIPKFALIPGAAVPLAILGGVGYVPNQAQSPVVIDTLRLLFAFVPACFNGLGLLVMWWYPLSEHVHGLVRQGVQRHREGEMAVDPITGDALMPVSQRAVDEETAWFLDYFSARELRGYLSGQFSLLSSVITWVIATGVLTLSSVSMAIFMVRDLEHDPGPLPSLSIVLAGACLTAFLFQLLRIAPARRLVDYPLDTAVIREHVREG